MGIKLGSKRLKTRNSGLGKWLRYVEVIFEVVTEDENCKEKIGKTSEQRIELEECLSPFR